MNEIVVNPDFESYRSFIENIPFEFDNGGSTIYKIRNEIKVFTLPDGTVLNVKRYKVPFIVNRFVYSFIRKPKVVRAYQYALLLRDKGFSTPTPVGYYLSYKHDLVKHSYLVTFQSSFPRNFYEFGSEDIESKRDIIEAFARYTAELHKAGIYHKDFSPGNILFEKNADGIHFTLVDINRMQFGKVGMRKGCKNFARLWGNREFFRLLAVAYATARGFDEVRCQSLIFFYRKQFWKKRDHSIFEYD